MIENSFFNREYSNPDTSAETINTHQESITNTERENHPKLELSPKAQTEFADLITNLIRDNKPTVIAVVRCWNKNSEQLQELQTRIEEMKENLPELAGILVAINADSDRNNMTSQAVDSLPSGSIPIIAIPVHGYSWTAGLNGPATLLATSLKESPEALSKAEIFNLSFDAKIPKSSLETMRAAITECKPALSLRIEEDVQNTDQAENIQSEYTLEIQALLARILGTIENSDTSISHHDKIVRNSGMALATLGRNTCSVIPLNDLISLGGFDPDCNKIGGMEDTDFFLRACFQDDGAKHKAYNDAIMKPILFQDLSWNKMPIGSSTEEKNSRPYKYEHEIEALTQIVSKINSAVHTNNDLCVANIKKDFKY